MSFSVFFFRRRANGRPYFFQLPNRQVTNQNKTKVKRQTKNRILLFKNRTQRRKNFINKFLSLQKSFSHKGFNFQSSEGLRCLQTVYNVPKLHYPKCLHARSADLSETMSPTNKFEILQSISEPTKTVLRLTSFAVNRAVFKWVSKAFRQVRWF